MGKPERSNTPHAKLLRTSTATLSLSSLTMMFIHQILCLAVIATRVRSMQEHRCLQSSPTFQKMVYDEDMRCARIVRYNPVNRRRLADSSYYCGPAAPDQDDVARFSTLPKRLPTKPKCPKSRRKKRQRRKPDNSDSGYSADTNENLEDSPDP